MQIKNHKIIKKFTEEKLHHIPLKKYYKYLGVEINKHGNIDNHIENIKNRGKYLN